MLHAFGRAQGNRAEEWMVLVTGCGGALPDVTGGWWWFEAGQSGWTRKNWQQWLLDQPITPLWLGMICAFLISIAFLKSENRGRGPLWSR